MPEPARSREGQLRVDAHDLGFDTIAITRAARTPNKGPALREFLENNFHGEMGWLAERVEQRAHPSSLWPAVKSIIVLGMNYGPSEDPLPALGDKQGAVISVYAQNNDYHDLIKKRLKALARKLISAHEGEVKVFVDTAPVMEKPIAQNAGIGWQGKHTNLVSREFGSWLFLGIIYTTLELEPDEPETDHCGSCSRCLSICPTNAFTRPYQLDARKCISYLTIEHKGPIPAEFRKAIGNRVYGCDDCLAVCPWNKYAVATQQDAFQPRDALKAPRLSALSQLDDAQFRTLFSKSPIKRIGRDRFIRNILIAIGNSQTPSLAADVEKLLTDQSALVRGTAVWALSQLADKATLSDAHDTYAAAEEDGDVLIEWREAISA